MEIKQSELKLLRYLYHSGREPYTKIAKKTGLTRIQVEYGVKKLQKQRIIKKFLTFFNYELLGYGQYVSLYTRLERFSTLKKFTEKLEKSEHCISWGECFGKYDVFANLVFKNEQEISVYLADLMQDKDVTIGDYLLNKPYFAEYYPLKLFGEKPENIFPLVNFQQKRINLDKIDVEILKILEKNARTKIVDIAHKTNISAELALHKLKKFHKNNIILGTKIQMDVQKIGYNYSGFFISVKNLSEKVKKRIITFARNHALIDVLFLSLIDPNCFMQVFHKTETELKDTIKEVKELLKDDTFELDILLLNEEDKINTLPFYTK